MRKVIDDRVAVLASDAAVETRFASARSVQDGHIRSFMCAPLWNQNVVIGVLYVDNPHTAQLSAADLDVLQALSSYAAVAIEQSRLSARIVEETRQRELLQRYHSAAVVDRILASPRGAMPRSSSKSATSRSCSPTSSASRAAWSVWRRRTSRTS